MAAVSIGIPMRNAEDYLEAAVESLLNQTRRPDEIVISDNASTDRSLRLAEGIATAEPTIRVIRHTENAGAASNFNLLVRETEGELFAWLAADDVWERDLLDGYVRAHERDNVAVAFGTSYYIDESGERVGAPPPAIWRDAASPVDRVADLLADPVHSHFHCCHPVFGLARRDLLVDTNLIRTFGGADRTLIFEMALRGRLTQVPEVFLRRKHPKSSVPANRDDASRRRWFDPLGRGAPMPVARLSTTLLTSTLRAPLTLRERRMILRQLAAWVRAERRPRIIGGECKAWIRHAIGVRE